ncbi:MAG: UGMP family protein, partial [Aigarchaeota archaeon]|nr:UGMP family protein [Aigarchaeota archaeon]
MSRALTCLGIESTAHTFGVGVSTSGGEILANENDSYVPREGGIHPREAAQHHSAVAAGVLSSALHTSGIEPRSLD